MKTHRIVHVVILNENNQILIIKRAKHLKLYPNHWSIPSGHIESGETPEQTLKREMKEELNAKITEIIRKTQTYKLDVGEIHWVVTTFLVKIDKIRTNEEISEYKWIHPKEIEDYRTTPKITIHLKKIGIL